MKYIQALALAVTAASALSIGSKQQSVLQDQDVLAEDLFLIELSPGSTRWVTDAQKWELKRVS